MNDRLKGFSAWVKEIDPVRAFVILLLTMTFGAGVTFSGMNSRIDGNSAGIASEKAARQDGEKVVADRISRGFDKIISRLDALDLKIDTKAREDAKVRESNAEKLGIILGLYRRNYGDIPADERN